MPGSNLDIRRAARVLVDAAFATDQVAADKHGISRRTVIKYRHRIDPRHPTFTPELADAYGAEMQAALEVDGWADELSHTIRDAMSAVRRACRELDATQPETLDVIARALQVLTDAALTIRMLDASSPDSAARDAAAEARTPGFAAPRGSA